MKIQINLFVFISVCFAALLLSGMEGCGKDEIPVAFIEAVPEDGSTIQTNETITAIFDGEPIGLSVTDGKPSVTGSAVTIVGPFDPGRLSLVLTWTRGAKALTYTVKNPETDENPETDRFKHRNESFGDPFENGKLQNPNWKWQNEPPDWDIRDYLYIDSENNRNIWASDKSHFLYQETYADMFDVETHFFSTWNTDSGVNGLLVKSPKDNNWVTIKFWSRDAGAKGQLQFQTRAAGVPGGPLDPPWRPDFGYTELFLRLKKERDHYTAWYKMDANDDWTDFGEGDFKMTPPLWLGIYAGVASGVGFLEVEYEYFQDNLTPWGVESEGKVATTWGVLKSRY